MRKNILFTFYVACTFMLVLSSCGKDSDTEDHKQEIEDVEDKLGIADPLLVLTDDVALSIGNCLIDARDSINQALSLMNIEESEELPDGLK